MLTRPVISRDELTALIDEGSIDSVVMGFVDRYGRLTGKRASGRFFVDKLAQKRNQKSA
jgi:glutamine synthetase